MKDKIKYSEEYIRYLLAYAYSSPFNRRQNLMVPNVSWGLDLSYEADVVVISKAGYATEIEIKISLADIKADRDKRHAHTSPLFKNLYYCFPAKLWEKAEEFLLPRAGVILVKGKRLWIEKKPTPLKSVKRLDDYTQFKLCRLGLLRYWGFLHKKYRNSEVKE